MSHSSTATAPVSSVPLQPIAVAAPARSARAVAVIGPSVVITGELTGAEDVRIEGRVEGKISLPGHLLTVGPDAKIAADVVAKAVIVQGVMTGSIRASARFEIKAGGCVNGDVVSAKVVMAEGAEFQGRVDMPRTSDLHAEPNQEPQPEPVAV